MSHVLLSQSHAAPRMQRRPEQEGLGLKPATDQRPSQLSVFVCFRHGSSLDHLVIGRLTARINPHRPMLLRPALWKKTSADSSKPSATGTDHRSDSRLVRSQVHLAHSVVVDVASMGGWKSVTCCQRATSLKHVVPEPCDQRCFTAGVSHRYLPKRHTSYKYTLFMFGTNVQDLVRENGVTERCRPQRMKTRDGMAVDNHRVRVCEGVLSFLSTS